MTRPPQVRKDLSQRKQRMDFAIVSRASWPTIQQFMGEEYHISARIPSMILKVVSLQSFSNPRLSLLNDGEREVQKLSSRAESDCQSDSSSEELSRKERSNSFSEDTGASGEHSNNGLPSNKSRGRRNDFKNGSAISEAIGKDQRYWEKRQRNNASAKRSRDARRVRELETQIRAEYLEDENYRLKVENEVLREENTRLLKTIERLKHHSSSKD